MNYEETLRALTIIKVGLPYALGNLKEADYDALIALWCRQFKDYSYDLVMAGIDSYIATNKGTYRPQNLIGEIKGIIDKLTSPDQMTEIEAWEIMKKAISRSGYYADEEYQKLPPQLQKLCSPQTLHEWSMTDTDEVNTVIASNFMRSYKARTEADKEMRLIPTEIKDQIALLANNMKMIGGK